MSESYRSIRAVEVYCDDCDKPYSHHPATVDVSIFSSIPEARAHINSHSLWAAGVSRAICGRCLMHYVKPPDAIRDMRDQLKLEQ